MAVIVSAGSLIQLQPVSAAFPGANGKIVFDSDRDGDAEIFVMNADGSGQTQITFNTASDTDPDWQPLFANPVGGIVMPTSKLEIVAPFAALAGLIAAVSAVVVVKKRRA